MGTSIRAGISTPYNRDRTKDPVDKQLKNIRLALAKNFVPPNGTILAPAAVRGASASLSHVFASGPHCSASFWVLFATAFLHLFVPVGRT